MSRRKQKKQKNEEEETSQASAAALFNTGVNVDFTYCGETREMRLDGTSLLADVKNKLAEMFGEGPLALVYEYGRGKKLYIRQDDEFQAAMISWPGCPKIKFRVILEALAEGDFDKLCVQRLKYLAAGDTKRLQDLEASINEKFEHPGTCMISSMGDATEMAVEHGAYHVLGLFGKMRQLTHPLIRRCGGNIIKAEGAKTFAVFDTMEDAITAGTLMMAACEDYSAQVDAAQKIAISIGIDTGRLLLIPHDLYGDCVNVASKLGEDSADAGDFFVSKDAFATVKGNTKFRSLRFEENTTKQSGVVLPYVKVTGRLEGSVEEITGDGESAGALAADYRETPFARLCRQRLAMEKDGDTEIIDEQIRAKYEMNSVVFVSDMSGFTRTVKRRGILHFLSLIMYMRQLVRPILEKHGGRIIKTEADNYYALFNSEDEALTASLESIAVLKKYNHGKDEDDHIILSVGIDTGKVLNVPEDHDIYGPARDRAEVLGEDEAGPYDVLVSQEVRNALRGQYNFDGEMKTANVGPGEDISFYNVIPK